MPEVLHKIWDYVFKIINPSTLIIFLLGLGVGFIGTQSSLRRKLRRNQKFLLFWVSQIEEPVKKQANWAKRLGDSFQKLDIRPIGKERFNLHVDKLKILTPLDMVQTFISNKSYTGTSNDQFLYRISSEIDLLESIQKANEINLDVCISMANEYQKEWDTNIQALHDWFRETAKENKIQGNAYLEAVYKIKDNCENKFKGVKPEDQLPLLWTKEYLLDELWKTTYTFKDYPNKQPYMNDLMKMVIRLGTTLDRKRINIGGYGNNFIESAQNLENSYTRLKEATKDITKSKFKWWFLLN